MTNLTEQWENKTLPNGCSYYCRSIFSNDVVICRAYYNSCSNKNVSFRDWEDSEIREIICKVPTYAEFKTLEKELERLINNEEVNSNYIKSISRCYKNLHKINRLTTNMVIEKSKQIETLQAKLQQAKEGLEFYGDEKNWTSKVIALTPEEIFYDNTKIEEDEGDKARETLEIINGENK